MSFPGERGSVCVSHVGSGTGRVHSPDSAVAGAVGGHTHLSQTPPMAPPLLICVPVPCRCNDCNREEESVSCEPSSRSLPGSESASRSPWAHTRVSDVGGSLGARVASSIPDG